MVSSISNTMSAVNASAFSASMWVIPPADNSNLSNFAQADLINVETNDGNGFDRLSLWMDTLLVGGVTPTRQFKLTLEDFVSGNPSNHAWGMFSQTNSYIPGAWHHLFVTADTASDSGFFYVNLVDRTLPFSGNDTGFDVPWNGCSFGLPTTPSQASTQTARLQMAEVQLWFGAFISPTADNLAKFVKVSGNTGSPRSASAAAAAFGVPTYYFSETRGNPTSFIANRGTGGATSLSGTIGDYTPVAGY